MKACKWCKDIEPNHWPFQCRLNPKKPRRIPQKGRRALQYEEWRDTIAKPFLDDTFGRKCSFCGSTRNLDVDHIKKRGSNPALKMRLDNVRYLCRSCHIKIT